MFFVDHLPDCATREKFGDLCEYDQQSSMRRLIFIRILALLLFAFLGFWLGAQQRCNCVNSSIQEKVFLRQGR